MRGLLLSPKALGSSHDCAQPHRKDGAFFITTYDENVSYMVSVPT